MSREAMQKISIENCFYNLEHMERHFESLMMSISYLDDPAGLLEKALMQLDLMSGKVLTKLNKDKPCKK